MPKKLRNLSSQPSKKKTAIPEALVTQTFKRTRGVKSFIRSNRVLKTANRLTIGYSDYVMIQQFALRELMEFRFAVFMLYYFGLRMSEVTCMTNINVKELVDNGTTVIVSTLMHTVKRLYAPQPVLKELFGFEAEIWDLFFNYRTRKTKYVMADRKGNPFSPLDVAEVINERLDDIVNYMDLEEEYCWSIGSLRGSFLVNNLSCNNNFFARYGYENRWFYSDEDPEFDLLLESNYTITYYFSRILEKDPYEHHSGLLVDRPYLNENPRAKSPITKRDKDRIDTLKALADSELIEDGLPNVYLEGCTLFKVGPERVD